MSSSWATRVRTPVSWRRGRRSKYSRRALQLEDEVTQHVEHVFGGLRVVVEGRVDGVAATGEGTEADEQRLAGECARRGHIVAGVDGRVAEHIDVGRGADAVDDGPARQIVAELDRAAGQERLEARIHELPGEIAVDALGDVVA